MGVLMHAGGGMFPASEPTMTMLNSAVSLKADSIHLSTVLFASRRPCWYKLLALSCEKRVCDFIFRPCTMSCLLIYLVSRA